MTKTVENDSRRELANSKDPKRRHRMILLLPAHELPFLPVEWDEFKQVG
jgi:hypothetical protein